MTVLRIEVAHDILHLRLDRDGRDIRRDEVGAPPLYRHNVAEEGRVDLEPELLLYALLQSLLRLPLAVDEEDLRGTRRSNRAHPFHDLLCVRMC